MDKLLEQPNFMWVFKGNIEHLPLEPWNEKIINEFELKTQIQTLVIFGTHIRNAIMIRIVT